ADDGHCPRAVQGGARRRAGDRAQDDQVMLSGFLRVPRGSLEFLWVPVRSPAAPDTDTSPVNRNLKELRGTPRNPEGTPARGSGGVRSNLIAGALLWSPNARLAGRIHVSRTLTSSCPGTYRPCAMPSRALRVASSSCRSPSTRRSGAKP